MNGGKEISCEFVVSGCDAAKILDPAEAAFDDISSSVGSLVEAVNANTVGFIWNDGLCTAPDDLGTQFVAVVPFISNQYAHARRDGENVGRGRDISILAACQMKDEWPAEWIA